MSDKFIYLDNAATTKMSPKVLKAMMPYLEEEYGNPSSIYAMGRKASLAVEEARDIVAQTIGASSSEIFFTSGGSESDNWAIISGSKAMAQKGKTHIISTNIEHHAVLHTLDALKKDGFEVTLVPVGDNGVVTLEDIKSAIRPETGLITVMYANNEIGTIQPISEIGTFCKENGIIFHTDAVQAIGQVDIDVKNLNVDLLSASAHKFHGPKGIGFLYIRKGVRLPIFINGGAQERGKRGGTENVASIVGLATAIEEATIDIATRSKKQAEIRDKIETQLLKISHCRLNGDKAKRLSNIVNISFEGIEGESILLMLDNVGIAASSGSACTSGSLDPSHVLLALGLKHEVAHGSLRISLGYDTTMEDADYLIQQVPVVIEKLRAMSPLWDKIINESN